jgi:hypothetical protein
METATQPASRRSQRGRRAGLWRGALIVVALLGVSMAGCASSATAQTNPPASKVGVAVTVLDHESIKRLPSDTTTLIIRLSVQQQSGIFTTYADFFGTDARTLVCDGVVMPVDHSGSLDDRYQGDYVGAVPPRTDQYTCVYSWGQGTQQAALAIPVLIPDLLHIQTPARRAIIQTPGPGSPGVTLTYAPASSRAAAVTATATDFNQRTATSGDGADQGSVTIVSSAFPTLFSLGWGTLTLTRSTSLSDLKSFSDNAAFAQASLDKFEQVDTIPVFWD